MDTGGTIATGVTACSIKLKKLVTDQEVQPYEILCLTSFFFPHDETEVWGGETNCPKSHTW